MKVKPKLNEVEAYDLKELLEAKGARGAVNLYLNENFVVNNEEIRRIVEEAVKGVDFRSYPEPYGAEAAKAIAGFYGLSEDEVFVGNGSDDALDRILRLFVAEGDNVVINEPTFFMYSFFARLYGGEKREVLLRPGFKLDVEGILDNCDEKTSMVIICSPNNPTGNQFDRADIEEILSGFDGLVVVDEAYADFGRFSLLGLIKDYENLIVLRSFSKAFGLASVRAGFAAANGKLVGWLRRSAGPFPVGGLTQRIVKAALENWGVFEKAIKEVVKERERLFRELKAIDGIEPFPSDANFILFKVVKEGLSAGFVHEALKEAGVYVKNKSGAPLLENCLRVTVGDPAMNERFLSSLKEILEGAG